MLTGRHSGRLRRVSNDPTSNAHICIDVKNVYLYSGDMSGRTADITLPATEADLAAEAMMAPAFDADEHPSHLVQVAVFRALVAAGHGEEVADAAVATVYGWLSFCWEIEQQSADEINHLGVAA